MPNNYLIGLKFNKNDGLRFGTDMVMLFLTGIIL